MTSKSMAFFTVGKQKGLEMLLYSDPHEISKKKSKKNIARKEEVVAENQRII